MERLTVSASRRPAAVAAPLVLAAAVAWFGFTRWMGDMPGVGADLGAATFAGSWALMMAAMMLPSMTPVVGLYDRMRLGYGLDVRATAAFVGGYLLMWTAAGLAAYALVRAGAALTGDALDWDNAGRAVAGATVLLAAVYQLTPLKDRCLTHCRSPLGFLLAHWRPGVGGAARMGAAHGTWCIGCCWALMATLFAVGLMSLGWMAAVAGLIALERLAPGGRRAQLGVAAVLAVLGIGLLAAPNSVPATDHDGGMTMMMDR
jgi:predicted metal-binding membrane protein